MPRTRSPILGSWHITEMEMWDETYLHSDVQAFIRFQADGRGEFQFGLVSGRMDCEYRVERGRSYVEFTWNGNDEMDAVSGRGFAVLLKGDKLKGRILFHEGDQSELGVTGTTRQRNP